MKFWLKFQRDGMTFEVDLGETDAAAALEVAAGFAQAAKERGRPIEFISVTLR